MARLPANDVASSQAIAGESLPSSNGYISGAHQGIIASGSEPNIKRVWAMPSHNTFDCPPIAGFVQKYLLKSQVSIDPFARNRRWATWTNDLNTGTAAEYHMEARDFLRMLKDKGVSADLAICDPPYSQVQVSRSYQDAGREYKPFGDDNNAVIYREVKSGLDALLSLNGIALCFGWNSAGFGEKRGYEIIEILLVCHGGAHNDTICVAERRKHNGAEAPALLKYNHRI